MRKNDLGRLLGCAALVLLPVMMATSAMAQAPAATPAPNPVPPPQIPPTLVPAHVVNLMTADGAAALGAQWKTMEAKIVESPPIKDTISFILKTEAQQMQKIAC